MNEFQLKYGTNPNQKNRPASLWRTAASCTVDDSQRQTGVHQLLDAFNSYQPR